MTISQDCIETLPTNSETKRGEFKSSFGKGVIETICAFANHKGGFVWIGVNGIGKPLGIIPDAKRIEIEEKQIVNI